MHIGLTGGPGTGKTTLAKALVDLVPELFYVYMSRFAVRIPMALRATTHPEILEYSKKRYITAILFNQKVQEISFTRAEMDAYASQVVNIYGAPIIGETALLAVPEGKTAVFDGVGNSKNIQYMKKKNVKIIALTCSFETQIQRRLKDGRDIDPKERSALERQLKETQELFQTTACLQIADAIYDTDRMRSQEIARYILPMIKRT